MSALRLSYFNLKLSLRPCFTFCAVFPKDFEMEKEFFIQLWMANGLVTSRGNLQMEHVGNEVWNELYQRSFFQEIKSDLVGNITFKMHDLVHDLAKSVIGEECMAFEAESLANLSSRVHHISCFDTKRKFDYNMIPFKKVESLRTFLSLDVLLSQPFLIPLRALATSSFQLSSLKNLIHLRLLVLCDSDITTLPASICKLQKLQTLRIESCNFFSSFPKQFKKLQDLRHLMIEDCPSLKSTPFRIGELTSLQTLTNFMVGSKTGFGLAELHKLQLGGKLYIKGLENVSNEDDAREANLIGKKDLNRLYLSWGDSRVSGVHAKRVLEALEPQSGIKHFGVEGYGGTDFPHWMKNTSILKGLVRIILSDCKNCRQLPPFGKLPCLNILFVSGMNDLKYIDDDMYEPATEKAFTSLKKMTLRDLPNLERVLEVEGVEMLPQLLKLHIRNVPKLTLPPLPSVKSFYAEGGNEELLKSIVDNSNLKSLHISKFARLMELPGTFELGTFSALEELRIEYCDEMESLSDKLLQGLSSLQKLLVASCSRFKSLSDCMRSHLTCLKTLYISDCPQFVFPHNMNNLTSLIVSGVDEKVLESLEGIPSLQSLSLQNFLSLTALPDCLGTMTSLQELYIIGFPKLSSLPDNFQQLTNLMELSIVDCPKLEKRCKRGIGEDWHKIAHIPEFYLESDKKPTFCDNIISAWKKQFWDPCQSSYSGWSYFDSMVKDEDK
ncbi:putative leucine-rich repeat domain, L domain-containing protein [Medicago truncatula]|nr:putative disease resistance protein RGA1 [Medicago truncatula]RHN51406.1 putative leucine-rich repeat domain, L domain-containing protein [Medicago truncatula]